MTQFVTQFRANTRLVLPGGQMIEPGDVFTLDAADLAGGVNVGHWLASGAVELGPTAEVRDDPPPDPTPPKRGRRGGLEQPPAGDADDAPDPAGWEVTDG